MNRIDTVKNRLAEISGGHEVTAGELADDLGLSRANVSSDLNRLCKEGVAEKHGTKPVYYKIAGAALHNTDSALEQFIQNNKSLFHAMEQAKASVLYPPHGMHMLLLGETGVGKSMLAEMIYQYAHDKGCIPEDAPFISFNCADYANNPQLLVSQLMGTRKGAYTGADADRPGLLEKADGGILFLDEVHRLPPEGQEMLFTFMDRGVYRRLGETDRERSAAVLLICATSEGVESSLLKTFVRRIPMIITVPNLQERGTDERLNLISTFFLRESARLEKPIFVSINSIRSLLSYRCPYNVGQLKNDIMIICAKAYSDFVSGRKQDLRIVSADLPEHIREGLYRETVHREIWNRLVGINKRFCVFDNSVQSRPVRTEDTPDNIYEIIDTHLKKLKDAGASGDEITKEIDRDIRLYFEKYARDSDHALKVSNVESLVGTAVFRVTGEILESAEKKLKHGFDENIRCGMALHIFSAVSRIGKGQKIVNPQINAIRKEIPAEFAAALNGLEIINRELGISMPIDEAGFLALFFRVDNLDPDRHSDTVQVVVIAHGPSTATSMIETANRLIGVQYAFGINAALEESPQSVYLRLKEHLQKHPAKKGLLLLVDMGSLTNFAADLGAEYGIAVRSIPLVSTLHVIEAARKALLGYSLDYVYAQTLNVSELLNESAYTYQKNLGKMFVVTVCTTGEGSAALIKRVLDGRLNYHEALCESISVSLVNRTDVRNQMDSIGKIGKIVCIVSAVRIDSAIPWFGLNEVLDGKAIPQIQTLIDQETVFFNIDQTMGNMLKNVNSAKILSDIRSTVESIQDKTGTRLTFDELVGTFFHIGCMMDRLIGKQPMEKFPEKEAFVAAHSQTVQDIGLSCRNLESKFGIRIPMDEICYIASIFTRRRESAAQKSES